MIQTDNAPTAEEIIRWFAERLCPGCSGRKQLPAQAYVGGATGKVDCRQCGGLGLAFEWASDECGTCKGKGNAIYIGIKWSPSSPDTLPCESCGGSVKDHKNGSGRVPKAVTSDDLWEHGLTRMSSSTITKSGLFWAEAGYPFSAEADTPTLAALRAIAAQAGM